MTDFAAASERAAALDEEIIADAAKISSNYVDLVSLSARQTLASLDITVGTDSKGDPNPSDVKVFMKDVGTSGCVSIRSFPTYMMYG